MILRVASFPELDARTLLAILKLRADVFVVEQRSPYQDIDGRDDAPGTLHLWFEHDACPAAYLRVLTEPDGSVRIGRVVTAADYRGRGLARRLMAAALRRIAPDVPCTLSAQTHLEAFYAGFGFVACGPAYDEDGVAHLPMRRVGSLGRPD